MLTQENREFVDFLFGKLFKELDTDMIDLHDDDTCCDELEFRAAELEMTVDDMLHADL